MSKYIFFAFIFFIPKLYSQVGINTVSPKASLDISSTNPSSPLATDGLLIPRLNVFPNTNPTLEQQGLQIYLTTDLTNVDINGSMKNYQKGFYYWDSTQTEWIMYNGNYWQLGGNNDTASGTNFIGTLDNAEFDIRVNNKLVSRYTELGQLELEADGQSILIGTQAGDNQDISAGGGLNTYIGYQAGMSSTAASNNVALGNKALSNVINGSNNFAIGNNVLNTVTSSSRNIAIGNNTLSMFNSGVDNIMLGDNLLSNASGYLANNIIIGNDGGSDTGTWNSILDNVIIGGHFDIDADLYSVSAIGYGVIARGNNATSLGNYAASGTNSIATGAYANATGQNSVAIGYFARTLSNNNSSALGFRSFANADWSTALGANSIVNAPDEVVIGDTAPASIGGYAGWSTLSDGRFKYDVKEDVPGIDFVTKLRPVTYKVDRNKLSKFVGAGELPTRKNRLLNRTETGFIAQEVEALATRINYKFDGVSKPDDLEKNHYKLTYSTFVPSLVKATQEQQILIEKLSKDLKEVNSKLEEGNLLIKTLIKRLENLEQMTNKG